MKEDRKNNCLYRAYDDTGVLLYVGISYSIAGRTVQHESGSKWHELAVKITIERFNNRALAIEAEKQAIIKERPIYNKANNPEYKHKEVKVKDKKKDDDCDKKQIGFFITQETKVKLQQLSMSNNRTLSGELTNLIEAAFNKMQDEQSQFLCK